MRLIGVGKESDNDKEEVEMGAEVRAAAEAEKERPKILKLISPCTTRWLIILDCIDHLLPQYDALSAHFQVAGVNERCYETKTLASMYKDETHQLYMIFLSGPLKEFKRISNLFQSNQPDNVKISGPILPSGSIRARGSGDQSSTYQGNGLEHWQTQWHFGWRFITTPMPLESLSFTLSLVV